MLWVMEQLALARQNKDRDLEGCYMRDEARLRSIMAHYNRWRDGQNVEAIHGEKGATKQ
jgi:hypothetical protein